MEERSRRKELAAQYKQSHAEAGVYRFVNTRDGRALIGSSTNLASMRNKLEFAQKTNTPSALDHRLHGDAREHGAAIFRFEVLEVLETKPEMTEAQIRADLQALEALLREQQDPALLY